MTTIEPVVETIYRTAVQPGGPDGLAGADIPLGAQVIAVCDAFDAMTCERSYRPARSADAALEELRHHAGTQFDRTVVAAFARVLGGDARVAQGAELAGAASG